MRHLERDVVVAFCAFVCAAGMSAQTPIPPQEPFQVLEAVDAGVNAGHGSCVAIMHGIAAVGAPQDEMGGKVRVWSLYGSNPPWSAPYVLESPDPQGGGGTTDPENRVPAFGSAIALTETFVAVGAPFHDTAEDLVDAGAASLYRRLPNGYQYMAMITSDRATEDGAFGTSMVFDDLGALHVGAPDTTSGRVERFVRDQTGSWLYNQSFTLEDGVTGDQFGRCLAWEGVTRSVVIGAPGRDEVLIQRLASNDSLPVPPMTTLLAPAEAVGFGSALDADSGFIVVGAPAGSSGGAVYVYAADGFVWTLRAVINAPEGASSFGQSVAVDGTDLLVGSSAFNTSHDVHAYTIPEDSDPIRTLLVLGKSDGSMRSVDVDSGNALTGDPFAGSSGQAYLSIMSRDCNANGVPDLDEIADNPDLDCNDNGIFDACDILDGNGTDCNGDGILDECGFGGSDCNDNGVPDQAEGMEFCVGSSPIPVDLIVVADPSGSDDQKLPGLCAEVFRTAVARLGTDFDVRAAWVSVMDQGPDSNCHDWTMPAGTPVRVCAGSLNRTIDDPDGDGEEWGDASAIMTTPYGEDLLGQLEGWDERDAVLILIPISDEGPQDGGSNDSSDPACDCEDESSVWNLIRQAWIENVQILPMPTEGTPSCVYDSVAPSSLMHQVASETNGSVIDARAWPQGKTSPELSQDLEDAVRAAIAASPRIKSLPEDFDGDGFVDVNDLLALIAAYGTMVGDESWDERYDLDQDGFIGVNDLLRVLDVYGETCDGRSSRTIRKPTSQMNHRPDSHSNQD